MSEWWNLDQAIVWIMTRDLQQVEWSEGDAEGIQERRHGYLNLDQHEVSIGLDTQETEPEGSGYGPLGILQKLLREGRVKAIRSDDERAAIIPSFVFKKHEIVLADRGLSLIFMNIRSRAEKARGINKHPLYVLLSSRDIVAHVTPRAPESLQQTLDSLFLERAIPDLSQERLGSTAAFPAPKERGGRKPNPATVKAAEIIAEMYPNGLPAAGEGKWGEQGQAIKKVQDALAKRGHGYVSPDTIRRIGRVKNG